MDNTALLLMGLQSLHTDVFISKFIVILWLTLRSSCFKNSLQLGKWILKLRMKMATVFYCFQAPLYWTEWCVYTSLSLYIYIFIIPMWYYRHHLYKPSVPLWIWAILRTNVCLLNYWCKHFLGGNLKGISSLTVTFKILFIFNRRDN